MDYLPNLIELQTEQSFLEKQKRIICIINGLSFLLTKSAHSMSMEMNMMVLHYQNQLLEDFIKEARLHISGDSELLEHFDQQVFDIKLDNLLDIFEISTSAQSRS